MGDVAAEGMSMPAEIPLSHFDESDTLVHEAEERNAVVDFLTTASYLARFTLIKCPDVASGERPPEICASRGQRIGKSRESIDGIARFKKKNIRSGGRSRFATEIGSDCNRLASGDRRTGYDIGRLLILRRRVWS